MSRVLQHSPDLGFFLDVPRALGRRGDGDVPFWGGPFLDVVSNSFILRIPSLRVGRGIHLSDAYVFGSRGPGYISRKKEI